MKAKISIAAALVVTVLFLAGCQSSKGGAGSLNAAGNKAAVPALLTEAAAKEIALDHTGLKESDVTRLTVKKDVDDGVTYYDVEFRNGIYEYSYEINAATGKIMEWNKDVDD